MLLLGKSVRHTRKVITNNNLQRSNRLAVPIARVHGHCRILRCACPATQVFLGEKFRRTNVFFEKGLQNPFAVPRHSKHLMMAINLFAKEPFEIRLHPPDFGRESHQKIVRCANIIHGPNSGIREPAIRFIEQVRHLPGQ